MLKVAKNNFTTRQSRSRLFALFMLAFFIIVMVTAQITIIAYTNHTCIGDGCPICKMIQNAGMLLRQISKALIAITLQNSALFLMAIVMMIIGLICNTSSTPVRIKVRLNN